MHEQVHETCGPILPDQIPADLIDAIYPTVLANGIPWHPDAVRILAAALLTEVGERIAQAVECELTEDLGDMLVVTVEGQRAAAIVRSWPEDLDA